jgi:hypothetical protein
MNNENSSRAAEAREAIDTERRATALAEPCGTKSSIRRMTVAQRHHHSLL